MNSEDNGQAVAALVPTGLADDQLLAVAAAAERRVDAINRIKILSLKVTNAHDWNDQGGKPYLGVSGAEKVARLFGISWRLNEPIREDYDDGHFDYSFKGFFTMGTAEIEVIGTRSSKDPFFVGSKDNPKPPSEIDRNDVKKGAMTNCLGNGISRLLGIRNMTWEELAAAGIKRDQIGKITYQDSDPNAAMKLPNYGRHKGQAMDDPTVPIDELRYYLSGAEKSISDPEKAKYKASNEKMRDALKAEIAKRDKPAPAPASTLTPAAVQYAPEPSAASVPPVADGEPTSGVPLSSTAPSEGYLLKVGRQKGQPLADQSDENLEWALAYYTGKMNSPANANSAYLDEWDTAIANIRCEILRRYPNEKINK